MASMAAARGLGDERVLLEESSTTTWENVAHAHALVGDAATVMLVSDGMHAYVAGTFWRRQFPDSALTVVVDPMYRLLDHCWVKAPATVVQVAKRLRRAALAMR